MIFNYFLFTPLHTKWRKTILFSFPQFHPLLIQTQEERKDENKYIFPWLFSLSSLEIITEYKDTSGPAHGKEYSSDEGKANK